jgi:hypothetical protein
LAVIGRLLFDYFTDTPCPPLTAAAEGAVIVPESKLEFYYEPIGLKTLVLSGLAALTAIAIIAAVAFVVVRTIRKRK